MEIFDQTAQRFARETDNLIAKCQYVRGELFVEAVRRMVPRHGRILDYGCGAGRISRLVAAQGYQVIGTDPSPGMIEQAQCQSIGNLDLDFKVMAGNGEQLETGIYDGIICSSVIEYVSDAQELLTHFYRSLVADGILLISYANRHSLWRKYANLRFPDAPQLRVQYHLWSFAEFKALVQRTHFQIESGPSFFDCPPFDKRCHLSFLSSIELIGTLALVIARAINKDEKHTT